MQSIKIFNGHKQYPQIQMQDYAVISKLWCRYKQFTTPKYANVLTTQPFTVLNEMGTVNLLFVPQTPVVTPYSSTVYSAPQNTCRASPYALNYSKNMDKGFKSEKTYLHLLIFQPADVDNWFPIF